MILNIAVTGCSGKVGRRVVLRALAQSHTVVGLDNKSPEDAFSSAPGFSFRHVDLTEYDKTLNALRGCNAVIHLAALPNPRDYGAVVHNINVVLSWNVLQAAAELGITRIAQASSINVMTLYFCKEHRIEYFPLDEDHPCLPDEPYGLSKLIGELQADTIVRGYPLVRIASLRIHYSTPSRPSVASHEQAVLSRDLWGYVQEDSGADAFLRAIESTGWSGHETFMIVAPETWSNEDTNTLLQKFWSHIPIKEGKDMSGKKGFYDCTKAERLLGWVHRDSV
jgi:nucleoside-diphosphate-sugar epimerase